MSTTSEDQRLKQAVRITVDKIVQDQGHRLKATMGPDFVDSLTDIVYKQMETFALDIESFASHARRAAINMDDVLLCARRNDDLYGILSAEKDNLAIARYSKR